MAIGVRLLMESFCQLTHTTSYPQISADKHG